ncbi:MAG: class I adenylate-forming enzyme family protein [Sphingomonadales bacterium]
MAFTIDSAIRWWSRECPDGVALSVEGEDCSWTRLYDWSGRVAAHIQNQGVNPGDRVMVVAANSLEYAVLIVAMTRIGAIGAPLSFRSAEGEVGLALDSLTPALIFTDPDRRAVTVAGMDGRNLDRLRSLEEIRSFEHGDAILPDHDPAMDAPLFIIGTSGSTAHPKGVVYTNFMVMTYVSEFVLMEPQCGKGSRILCLGPFSSASGYLVLLQFLASGATVYMETRFDPARALDVLVRHQINTYLGAPIFFERLSALPAFTDADLSHLHFTQVGGARVDAALQQAWLDKGVVLRQAYGCTESGGAWAARDDTALSAPEKCGHGGMFTEYAIRAEDGGFASPGTTGEILIRGPYITPAYWNNPDATAEALRDGWLHTGDIGVMDEAANLTFITRLKDIIISGGLNVSAAELERVISGVDGVEEVAVVPTPDRDYGEAPVAVVYGDRERLSVERIMDHCGKHLARYKLPGYVIIEDKPLPRLTSGKIAKPAIREQYGDASDRFAKTR